MLDVQPHVYLPPIKYPCWLPVGEVIICIGLKYSSMKRYIILLMSKSFYFYLFLRGCSLINPTPNQKVESQNKKRTKKGTEWNIELSLKKSEKKIFIIYKENIYIFCSLTDKQMDKILMLVDHNFFLHLHHICLCSFAWPSRLLSFNGAIPFFGFGEHII